MAYFNLDGFFEQTKLPLLCCRKPPMPPRTTATLFGVQLRKGPDSFEEHGNTVTVNSARSTQWLVESCAKECEPSNRRFQQDGLMARISTATASVIRNSIMYPGPLSHVLAPHRMTWPGDFLLLGDNSSHVFMNQGRPQGKEAKGAKNRSFFYYNIVLIVIYYSIVLWTRWMSCTQCYF